MPDLITATERAGVCRDFAHLAISFCRALGIPARYASAYAWRLDPPDFHAVIEAFLVGPSGPGWYLCDPTRKAAANGLARIGVARDAAEVAFASPFGQVGYGKPDVWIRALDENALVEITTMVSNSLQKGPRIGVQKGVRLRFDDVCGWARSDS